MSREPAFMPNIRLRQAQAQAHETVALTDFACFTRAVSQLEAQITEHGYWELGTLIVVKEGCMHCAALQCTAPPKEAPGLLGSGCLRR